MITLLCILSACFVLALVVITFALYTKNHVRASLQLRSFVFFLEAENNDTKTVRMPEPTLPASVQRP